MLDRLVLSCYNTLMHSLLELKELFEKNGIKVESFSGYALYTEDGKWGMAFDEYYFNSVLVDREKIKNMFKKG